MVFVSILVLICLIVCVVYMYEKSCYEIMIQPDEIEIKNIILKNKIKLQKVSLQNVSGNSSGVSNI